MNSRFYFRHRGLKLSYLDSAPQNRELPAVLLLHGFPDHAAMWTKQVSALHAAGYRCIAPDTVGCGESDIAPRLRDYDCVTIAGDHVALLDYLGIGAVHIIGHDWGAVIGWLFAGHHPVRTRCLIAMSVGHPTAYARSGLHQKRLAWYTYFFMLGGFAERRLRGDGRFSLGRVFSTHPDMEDVMTRMQRPGRLRAALRIYRAAIVPVLLRRQPDVSAPTLGLWSDGDRFLVESQMRASARFCSGSWHYEKLRGHHWMSLEQPERINSLIFDHLTRASRESRSGSSPSGSAYRAPPPANP